MKIKFHCWFFRSIKIYYSKCVVRWGKNVQRKVLGYLREDPLRKGSASYYVSERWSTREMQAYERLGIASRAREPNTSSKDPTNGLWIHPTYVGNRARYINHSCRPNAILEEVTLVGTTVRVIVMTGIASIERETEIIIDYGWDSVRAGEKGAAIHIFSCGVACCRRTT